MGRSVMQFRRGIADRCVKYEGLANEIIFDMTLFMPRLYSGNGTENRVLEPGELMQLYKQNGYEFYTRSRSCRLLTTCPDTPFVTVKFLRGATQQVRAFIGAPGEIVHDIETDTLYLHDGEAVGGHPL